MQKKNPLRFLALLSLVLTLFPLSPASAEDQAEKGFALMKEETLGSLKLSLPAEKVQTALGKPAKVGKEEEWGATGDFVETWSYPALGLSLQMASEKKGGKKSVLMLTATSPSKLATKRGIKIGDSEAAVRKAYGTFEDKESTVKGNTFVAGTVYGGVVFEFKSGAVSSIFIGAGAE